PVFFTQHQASDADVLGNNLAPVPAVLEHETLKDKAAGGIEVAFNFDVETTRAQIGLPYRLLAPSERNDAQWLVVHRRIKFVLVATGQTRAFEVDPLEGVQRSVRRFGVRFEPLFQHAGNRALARSHRTVKQD